MPIGAPGLFVCHVPKTCGTYLAESARRVFGVDHVQRIRGQHCTLEATKDFVGSRLTMGTVRNPWDWACSWWAHAMRGSNRHQLVQWGGGSHDFPRVLEGVCRPTAERVPDGLGAAPRNCWSRAYRCMNTGSSTRTEARLCWWTATASPKPWPSSQTHHRANGRHALLSTLASSVGRCPIRAPSYIATGLRRRPWPSFSLRTPRRSPSSGIRAPSLRHLSRL